MKTNEKTTLFFTSKTIAIVGLSLNKPGSSNLVYDVLKKK